MLALLLYLCFTITVYSCNITNIEILNTSKLLCDSFSLERKKYCNSFFTKECYLNDEIIIDYVFNQNNINKECKFIFCYMISDTCGTIAFQNKQHISSIKNYIFDLLLGIYIIGYGIDFLLKIPIFLIHIKRKIFE